MKKFTVLGNGSWSSALVKLLTDNKIEVNWWMRDEESVVYLKEHAHNPRYLTSVEYSKDLISPTADLKKAIAEGEIILIGIPSAYVATVMDQLPKDIFKNKKVLSATKGLVSDENLLMNHYLRNHYALEKENYFCITGPCHAEEVASEKLSYLTFGGYDEQTTKEIADCFQSHYLKTVTSKDVKGIQYASVLKNIYALGAGIAHGLDYGDNFQSVYITNCFAELQNFMNVMATEQQHHYNTSAYLGDLLVTCYSMHSRNRAFGNYIGKGYSVKTTKLEMNMEAEGYFASKGIVELNKKQEIPMPIASAVYRILYEKKSPKKQFRKLEQVFE
jgi:glycerol-3-phosphate dehydrogenase (NAD(P)+)